MAYWQLLTLKTLDFKLCNTDRPPLHCSGLVSLGGKAASADWTVKTKSFSVSQILHIFKLANPLGLDFPSYAAILITVTFYFPGWTHQWRRFKNPVQHEILYQKRLWHVCNFAYTCKKQHRTWTRMGWTHWDWHRTVEDLGRGLGLHRSRLER